MIFNGAWSAPAGQTCRLARFDFHAIVLVEPGLRLRGQGAVDDGVWRVEHDHRRKRVDFGERLVRPRFSRHSSSFANEMRLLPLATRQSDYRTTATFAPITEIWVVKDVMAYGGMGDDGLRPPERVLRDLQPDPRAVHVRAVGHWRAGAGWLCVAEAAGLENRRRRLRFRPRRNDIAVDVDGRLGFPGFAVCVARGWNLPRANPAGSPAAAGLCRRHAI